MQNLKLLVIGLDGATWNVLIPLIKKGKLHTLEELMNNGVYGDLESTIPHITFPAWKSYSTGKNPGKLGVYWFLYPNFKEKSFLSNNSKDFKSYDYWDILGTEGIQCGILDMPGTYPPKEINGFMVSWGAPKQENYTYPPKLAEEIESKFDYRIDPEFFFDLNKEKGIKATKKIIKQRFEVARWLIEDKESDFFHMTIFHIDSVQHVFWRDMIDEKDVYANVIEDFWRLIDQEIGNFLEKATDENTTIILMSDHGFTKVKAIVNMSIWLRDNRYLILTSPKISKILSVVGINRDLVFRVVDKLNLVGIIRKLIPKDIAIRILDRFFPPSDDVVSLYSLERAINWSRSQVIPLPEGPIYINSKIKSDKKKYEKLRNELINKIESIKNPKTGERLAKKVYKKEELYRGKYLSKAPDLVILPNEGYEIATPAESNKMWIFNPKNRTGTHKIKGIFLASGPKIKKDCKIENIKIYDIAPTILHIFGFPLPSDIDGKVLTEIFEDDSEFAKRKARYVDPIYYEKEKIKEKIGKLKKIGKI